MAKKKSYQEELFSFLETEPTEPEITFPLCIKAEDNGYKGDIVYTRYCGDGRYECICESNKSVSLTFGVQDYSLGDDKLHWLKVSFFRARNNKGGQSLITTEEFDKQVELIINGNYTEYLAGRKYVDSTIATPNRDELKIEESSLNTKEEEQDEFKTTEDPPPF